MKYQTKTLRKILSEIPSQYYLPPIQRTFVWDEERIQKLFDSILRGYPISTFLFWTTNDPLKLRKFIQNYVDDVDLDLFRIPADDSRKTLILDGQQRLQSLYVGAEGVYNSKELHFDPRSGGTVDEVTGERYMFRFFGKDEDSRGWVKFKDILHLEPRGNIIRNFLTKSLKEQGESISPQDDDQIDANSSEILARFMIDEVVAYYEIDSIIGPIKEVDEIYEIFVRANSGGVPLTKSDLVFSTMVLAWSDADSSVERLVRELNQGGRFNFDNDIVIKACLTFIGARARYDVNKLRGENGKQNLMKIRNDWMTIANSLKSVVDLIARNGITSDNALYSYNALIPIGYYAYLRRGVLDYREDHNIFTWLCFALLNRDFSGQSDTVIDNCKRTIDQHHARFPHQELDQAVPASRKTGLPTDISQWKGGESLMLSLVYRRIGGVNFKPLIKYNEPEMDHIFPQSKLKKMNVEKALINDIGNLRYVSDQENRDKTDENPDYWFENLSDAANLPIHLIPDNKSLWALDKHNEFIAKRRQDIFDVLKQILNYNRRAEP